MHKTIIAWDLGATKCKAGMIKYQPETGEFICRRHHSVKLTEAASLTDLINQLETGLGISMADADAVCIGAAGTFDGSCIHHANPYPFPMTIADTAKELQWPPYAVIHDYASIVCSTFTPIVRSPDAVQYLTDPSADPHGRRVAFGIGTGLGLKDGIMLPNGDFWFGHNEIGHIGVTNPPLANDTHLARHLEIMRFLKGKGDHGVTFEEILSGRGTARLHAFFYPNHALTTPEETGARMRSGQTPQLMDALAWYLGLLVGSIQLIFMPAGGIYITGGVTLNHLDLFNRSDFFDGIHASPAYLTQRKEYPLGILRHPEAALIGCAYYAVKRL